MIDVIEHGVYVRGMVDRPRELNDTLSAAPVTLPDVHSIVADIHRRKVERLAVSPNKPEERDEAAATIQ